MLIPATSSGEGWSREPAVSDVEIRSMEVFNSLFTYSDASDSARVALGRRDILVHSEKVSRIELPLERGETRQLRPVCRPDSIRSFVAAQIIHVCALGEIGPEHIEKFARPGDVALRILRIGPGGGHDEIVRPRAMAEAVADSGTRSQALSPLCSNTITVRLDGTRIKQSTKTSIA